MDWVKILQMGAEYIQKNDDESTSNIDIGDIATALQSVFSSENGLDLGAIFSQLQDSNLSEIVASWVGSGENKPIEPDQVEAIVPQEKIEALANQLGISHESAKKALADALPRVVDEATNEEPSLAEQLFNQIGGVEGAINMLKKFF